MNTVPGHYSSDSVFTITTLISLHVTITFISTMEIYTILWRQIHLKLQNLTWYAGNMHNVKLLYKMIFAEKADTAIPTPA